MPAARCATSSSEVWVGVRPEKLRVTSDMEAPIIGNCLDGTVTDASFMGSDRRLRLTNERFGTLVATLPGSTAEVPLDAEVGVTFEPDAAWVVM